MSNLRYQGVHNLQNGLTILPAQDEAIDRILSQLIAAIPAHFALLTGNDGQVVAFSGGREQLALVALGALVAGEQVAGQEMARVAGEYQTCQMTIREGTSSNFYVCDAGRYLVLLVKASNDIPLGWARMMIRRASEQLAHVIALSTGEQTGELNEMATVPDAQDDLLASFGDSWQELAKSIDDAVNSLEV